MSPSIFDFRGRSRETEVGRRRWSRRTRYIHTRLHYFVYHQRIEVMTLRRTTFVGPVEVTFAKRR